MENQQVIGHHIRFARFRELAGVPGLKLAQVDAGAAFAHLLHSGPDRERPAEGGALSSPARLSRTISTQRSERDEFMRPSHLNTLTFRFSPTPHAIYLPRTLSPFFP